MAPTDPGKAQALAAAVEDMYAEFAKDGPTADELAVAKRQMTNLLDEILKDPGFWSSRLAALDYRGQRIDDLLGARAAYEGFTADEVRDGVRALRPSRGAAPVRHHAEVNRRGPRRPPPSLPLRIAPAEPALGAVGRASRAEEGSVAIRGGRRVHCLASGSIDGSLVSLHLPQTAFPGLLFRVVGRVVFMDGRLNRPRCA